MILNPSKLGGILLLAFLPLTGNQAEELIRISPENQASFGIELASPEPAQDTLSRRYPAKVAVPNRQLRVVSAPQNGILEALLVAEGEQVQEGQILARLRSPELLQTQSDYLESHSRLELARSELERNRKLHSEGIVAQRRLLESRAAYRELETSADRHQQRLELAGMSAQDIDTLQRKRRLTSSLAIRSPLDGVVLAQNVSTGQAVAAADPLYRIGQLDVLWLEVHVPVDQLGPVRTGAPVRLPALNSEGRVVTIGRMVHQADQGVLVRVEIRDGVQDLRPGQFVEVQLAESAGGSAWRVSTASVLRNGGADYLFLAREGGFIPLPVQVKASEERHKVVSGDMNANDQVVTRGVAALKAAWLGGSE